MKEDSLFFSKCKICRSVVIISGKDFKRSCRCTGHNKFCLKCYKNFTFLCSNCYNTDELYNDNLVND